MYERKQNPMSRKERGRLGAKKSKWRLGFTTPMSQRSAESHRKMREAKLKEGGDEDGGTDSD